MPISFSSYAIVSEADVKAYLNMAVSETSSDTLIKLAVDTISRAFANHCGYSIPSKDYSDVVLNGAGRTLLRFPAFNVTACSLVEYRSSYTAWNELSQDLWELDLVHKLGVVGYAGFCFAEGRQNWRATYTAGWSAAEIPGAIYEAALIEIKEFVERRQHLASENMGGQSASGLVYRDVSAATRKALQPYRVMNL